MKRIELKCCCGASIVLVDERGAYLHPGGTVDGKGRMFVIQQQADNWLDRHDKCSGAASVTADKANASKAVKALREVMRYVESTDGTRGDLCGCAVNAHKYLACVRLVTAADAAKGDA
jgi:hypothetical protein